MELCTPRRTLVEIQKQKKFTCICKRSSQSVPLPRGGCTSNTINLTSARLRRARLGVIQPPVLEEELTLGWLAVKRIVPVGFRSRVRVDDSVADVNGVKVKVREQQRGNEFDIEPRKSRTHANRPPCQAQKKKKNMGYRQRQLQQSLFVGDASANTYLHPIPDM
jgi:hypothetical protein